MRLALYCFPLRFLSRAAPGFVRFQALIILGVLLKKRVHNHEYIKSRLGLSEEANAKCIALKLQLY